MSSITLPPYVEVFSVCVLRNWQFHDSVGPFQKKKVLRFVYFYFSF